MQRRYVAVRGASLAGGAFQSWLGDILESRLLLEGSQQRKEQRKGERATGGEGRWTTVRVFLREGELERERTREEGR